MKWGKEYPTDTHAINSLCAIPPKKMFIWIPRKLKNGQWICFERIYWKWDRNYYDGHLVKRYAKSKSDLR